MTWVRCGKWRGAAAVVLGVVVWLGGGVTAGAQGKGGAAPPAQASSAWSALFGKPARGASGPLSGDPAELLKLLLGGEAAWEAFFEDLAVEQLRTGVGLCHGVAAPSPLLATLQNPELALPRPVQEIFAGMLSAKAASIPSAHPAYARGHFAEGLSAAEQLLVHVERELGQNHPLLAHLANNLAELHREAGQYDLAEPLYRRAIGLAERAGVPVAVARFNVNLGNLYQNRGAYLDAERVYQHAIDVAQSASRTDLPEVGAALNGIGAGYVARGDLRHGEQTLEEAQSLLSRACGEKSVDVASPMLNLAALHELRRAYDRAQRLHELGIQIFEAKLGPEHPALATALSNLGRLHLARGALDRAEPLLLRALAIRDKTLGPDHPDVAVSLNNLAELHQARGAPDRAEPLYLQAIAIEDRAFGAAYAHPSTALILSNLALSRLARRAPAPALQALARAIDIQDRHAAPFLVSGSEEQKRVYLVHLKTSTDAALSTSTRHAPTDPAAARLALTAVLQRKARALDATASGYAALRARATGADRAVLDDLRTVNDELVALASRVAVPDVAIYRRALEGLQEKRDRLEAEASAQSAAFRAEQPSIQVATIQAALPEGAALVEWAVYKPYDPDARTRGETWGPARYAAIVLPRQGDPIGIDLGAAAAIDADVQSLRDAFARPANPDAPKLARALEAKVMAPVRAALGDTRRVFLSPDGALNLIPFGALAGDDGRPLIERYAFTYLTSGRDLLRRGSPTPVRAPPLVVTAPDFDLDQPTGTPFHPLLHAAEVQDILTARFQHPVPVVLPGRNATKARLQEAHGPQFLHVDSHGYFDPKVCNDQPSPELLENPLLRSGIALAGANACAQGDNRGLLTASEASALDLYGTRLVVLSACETGVGKVEAGDGVYGLRRALVLAGAETQVMSLWKVEEARTAALMKAYYEGLAQGGGRSEAMRRAQLAMLHDGNHEHPYYWSSFVVSGDDRSLDGALVDPDLRVPAHGACACLAGERGAAEDSAWMVALAASLLVVRSCRATARRRMSAGASGRSPGARPVSYRAR